MSSPFYRVFLEDGTEITQWVSKFNYQDCTKKDDLLEISMGNVPNYIFDNPHFVKGADIRFQWGYIGGRSREETLTIEEALPRFADMVTCNLKALDKGQAMKKADKSQTWKDVTAAEIIQEIAKRHKLTPVFTPMVFTKKWSSVAQGNKTDYEFVAWLVAREQGGEWVAYVKGKTMQVKRRDLSKTPLRKFIYAEGKDVISFSPKSTATGEDGAATETTAVSFDMEKKQKVEHKASAENDKTTSLGGKQVRYNGDANQLGTAVSTGKKVLAGTAKPDEVQDRATKHRKDAQLKTIEADMETVGDAWIKADEIYTIGGVPKKYSGNYYAEEVHHSIQGDSFKNTFKLLKDGTAEKISKSSSDASKKNDQVGNAEAQRTSKIYRYDANSNEKIVNK